MSLERVYDLAFAILPDGTVELEQGIHEVNRITLHPSHLHLLLERAGYLLPPPPDETAKRLVKHLFELREILTGSPDFSEITEPEAVSFLYAQLDAFCEAQPANLRPQIVGGESSAVHDTPVSEPQEFQLTHPA